MESFKNKIWLEKYFTQLGLINFKYFLPPSIGEIQSKIQYIIYYLFIRQTKKTVRYNNKRDHESSP